MTRVVITGMGVVAPNGIGVHAFCRALKEGQSGVTFQPAMREKNFACQVAGAPEIDGAVIERIFDERTAMALNSSLVFAGLAAVECWRDGGFLYERDRTGEVHWETGAVIGSGMGGMDTISDRLIPLTSAGQTRRLGSTVPERAMLSASSAFIGGLFGLGGPVTTVSSACATGTEAVYRAVQLIREGRVDRMLAGSTEGNSIYTWAGFDAMRVCAHRFNDSPESASRPLSASACGFVPSGGAGVLLLERLETARARGARIYAEVLGGHVNSGGQRNGGTITAANPAGVQRCVKGALSDAGLDGSAIDYVNGHLTATAGDRIEIRNLQSSLGTGEADFPWINSTKSMIGHGLGASGSMECVASVIQLHEGFLHPSLNAEDLLPCLEPLQRKIPVKAIEQPISTCLKVSFGFGDVNACVVFRKWVES